MFNDDNNNANDILYVHGCAEVFNEDIDEDGNYKFHVDHNDYDNDNEDGGGGEKHSNEKNEDDKDPAHRYITGLLSGIVFLVPAIAILVYIFLVDKQKISNSRESNLSMADNEAQLKQSLLNTRSNFAVLHSELTIDAINNDYNTNSNAKLPPAMATPNSSPGPSATTTDTTTTTTDPAKTDTDNNVKSPTPATQLSPLSLVTAEIAAVPYSYMRSNSIQINPDLNPPSDVVDDVVILGWKEEKDVKDVKRRGEEVYVEIPGERNSSRYKNKAFIGDNGEGAEDDNDDNAID